MDHRHGRVGRDERGQDMVPAVPGRTVAVAPPIVRRQYVVERAEKVVIRTGAGLDECDAGRGVRNEHMQQAVSAAGRTGEELVGLLGHIANGGARSSPYGDDFALHLAYPRCMLD